MQHKFLKEYFNAILRILLFYFIYLLYVGTFILFFLENKWKVMLPFLDMLNSEYGNMYRSIVNYEQ